MGVTAAAIVGSAIEGNDENKSVQVQGWLKAAQTRKVREPDAAQERLLRVVPT